MPCEKLGHSDASRRAFSSTARTAAIAPSDWSSGVVGDLGGDQPAVEREHGIGERPSDIDAEEHGATLPSGRDRKKGPANAGPA